MLMKTKKNLKSLKIENLKKKKMIGNHVITSVQVKVKSI